jgi:hypothetical protein
MNNHLKVIHSLYFSNVGHLYNNKLHITSWGPTKGITVCDTPPYGHAPTYQISLTYLERQKSYGPDKLCWEEAEEAEAEEKIRLKQYVSLRSKERHNYVCDGPSWDLNS